MEFEKDALCQAGCGGVGCRGKKRFGYDYRKKMIPVPHFFQRLSFV